MDETISRFIYVHEIDLRIDLLRGKITWRGKNIKVSLKVYSLLIILMTDPHRLFPMSELMEYAGFTTPTSLWQEIHRLRNVFNQEVVFTCGHSQYSLLRER